MKIYIRSGWNWYKDHIYIWIVLFLYQLLWGFFVYRIVDGIVTPILRRYPNPAPTKLSRPLFWTEFQFHLMKTNHYMPYLWTFIGFIAIHILLTPLIQGVLLRSMSEPKQQLRLALFQSVKTGWKPLYFLCAVEALLCITPSYWFVPFMMRSIQHEPSIASLLITVAPFAITWLLCGWLLHQLFWCLKFGATAEVTFIRAVRAGYRCMLPFLGLSLLFIAATITISVLFTTAEMVFTGLIALIIQQALPAIFILLKLWGLSSRHAAWQEAERLMK